MENHTLLITGAEGGLGQIVLARLLADQWNLRAGIHQRKSGELLQSMFPQQYGHQLTSTQIDLTQADQVKKWIQESPDFFGLIHLAGGFKMASTFENSTDEDFDDLIHLNIRATFNLFREVLPILKNNRNGCVVCIGAKPALHPEKENATYACTKAAVHSLTLAAAEECRPYQVRVNAIIPGIIKTPSNMQGKTEEETGKWTPPQDMANLIAFLVSDQGKGITGSLIPMFHKIKT
ncbi:MAG: SDR family NAD(P)-dependent oxidoreductase [Chitinophagaceae bacterium]